jgi:hypothetical protein
MGRSLIVDLLIFFAAEVVLILGLYRFLLRQWIIQHWEEKLDEEGWLVLKLNPVVDEIEDRLHDKLQLFQDSFFGSVGAMTKKAKDLDPMNNVRKAAKDGDWMSLMVEYAANKAGLGALVGQQGPNAAEKGGETSPKQPLNTNYLVDYLNK